MTKKKTGLNLMIMVFLLLLLGDYIATYATGVELLQYLEANPLYPHVWLIIGLNFVLVSGLYWLYNRSRTVTTHFIYLNTLVTICVVRLLVIWNNIQVAMNPPTIQQAMQVTQAVKTAAIAKFAIIGFVPYLIAIFTFYVFKLDHKIEMKDNPKDDPERYYIG